ncbi:hypothetical protein [Nonomuraea fuscirosea]|uniref:hypothetical protein n=1 Tax=Nonomuraea fuscirosea TaxID=1291556 RepID=UPI0033FF9519
MDLMFEIPLSHCGPLIDEQTIRTAVAVLIALLVLVVVIRYSGLGCSIQVRT